MTYKLFIATFDEHNYPNQSGTAAHDAIQLTPATLRADGALPVVPRAIYVCTVGNIDWEGTTAGNRRITPVNPGAVLPFIPTKIYSAGTTATIELWY